MHTRKTLVLSLMLICLLLLSLCLPSRAAYHVCDHDCCAICQAIELGRQLLFCVLLLADFFLRLGCAAVRAFVRTRAEGRLFYTLVVLKVKLSD